MASMAFDEARARQQQQRGSRRAAAAAAQQLQKQRKRFDSPGFFVRRPTDRQSKKPKLLVYR